MALTPRQQRFVEEYLVDLNATAAYKRAGYKAKGRAAENAASRLLGVVGVQEAITTRQQARSQATGITAERVLIELARVALVDPRGFYKPDGTIKRPSEFTDEQAAALASLEVFEEFEGAGDNRRKTGEVRKVKFWPKVEALRLVAQHLGMLVEKHELMGSVQLELVEEIVEPTVEPLTDASHPAQDPAAPNAG